MITILPLLPTAADLLYPFLISSKIWCKWLSAKGKGATYMVTVDERHCKMRLDAHARKANSSVIGAC